MFELALAGHVGSLAFPIGGECDHGLNRPARILPQGRPLIGRPVLCVPRSASRSIDLGL